MTKHSKNNTASSIFSYAEYKKLPYGTKRQRLGADSLRPFDACVLCLQRARTPVACAEGHLFCKECVYADLLEQRKGIKKEKERLERAKREQQQQREEARRKARERVLEEFERAQLGLAGSAPASSTSTKEKEKEEPSASRGTKRKFAFDASAAEEAAREAEEAALRALEREQAEALRAKLPDFWLPSLTPTHKDVGLRSLADVRVGTVCRGGGERHGVGLKELVQVEFSVLSSAGAAAEEGGKKSEDGTKICLSCKKELSNSLRFFLMKSCAHVACKTCTDTLIRPSQQCTVCDKPVAEKDVVELKREGTGFAGGGMAETKKAGIAFQG
ncbi:hypothetical protein K488DRAFT_60244 [Vararia minispora EC-137]|uniref:Uncharacterized protein n=1 Tax=Vararia minispora EC-137 TaxID=1314806 RepID=A0ACB8Q854_9AGAM|nr:hypothetical protein K488DRAFT_60244 [Vararia minispora EC-137]